MATPNIYNLTSDRLLELKNPTVMFNAGIKTTTLAFALEDLSDNITALCELAIIHEGIKWTDDPLSRDPVTRSVESVADTYVKAIWDGAVVFERHQLGNSWPVGAIRQRVAKVRAGREIHKRLRQVKSRTRYNEQWQGAPVVEVSEWWHDA